VTVSLYDPTRYNPVEASRLIRGVGYKFAGSEGDLIAAIRSVKDSSTAETSIQSALLCACKGGDVDSVVRLMGTQVDLSPILSAAIATISVHADAADRSRLLAVFDSAIQLAALRDSRKAVTGNEKPVGTLTFAKLGKREAEAALDGELELLLARNPLEPVALQLVSQGLLDSLFGKRWEDFAETLKEADDTQDGPLVEIYCNRQLGKTTFEDLQSNARRIGAAVLFANELDPEHTDQPEHAILISGFRDQFVAAAPGQQTPRTAFLVNGTLTDPSRRNNRHDDDENASFSVAVWYGSEQAIARKADQLLATSYVDVLTHQMRVARKAVERAKETAEGIAARAKSTGRFAEFFVAYSPSILMQEAEDAILNPIKEARLLVNRVCINQCFDVVSARQEAEPAEPAKPAQSAAKRAGARP